MKFDRKLFNIFQSLLLVQIYLAYCFIISGVIVNFIQLLTWIFIWPFNKQLYRRLNYHLVTLIWSQLTFIYSWWSNSDEKIFADPKDMEYFQKESVIYLSNHRYEIDWLFAFVFNRKFRLLGGTKIVGKHSLSLIPVLGWSWFFTESIFLRRIWDTDKKILEHDIQQLVNGYPDNYYFNVIMTCEGTRFTEAKRLDSMKYAREKNLPELKYHILPRTRGLTMIMQGAKGKLPAVYNFTLVFSKDNGPPTLRSILNGQSYTANVYFKRIPMSEIPYEDEAKCAEWINQLFQEKDRIFEHFVQHDTFDGLGLPEVSVTRTYSDLFIQIFWFIAIGTPSVIWFFQFILNSSLFAKFIFGIIIFIAYLFLQWMISQSVVKTDTTIKKND